MREMINNIGLKNGWSKMIMIIISFGNVFRSVLGDCSSGYEVTISVYLDTNNELQWFLNGLTTGVVYNYNHNESDVGSFVTSSTCLDDDISVENCYYFEIYDSIIGEASEVYGNGIDYNDGNNDSIIIKLNNSTIVSDVFLDGDYRRFDFCLNISYSKNTNNLDQLVAPCPSGYISNNITSSSSNGIYSNWYYGVYCDSGLRWHDGLIYCQRMFDSSLASIHSKMENEYALSTLLSFDNQRGWIGLNDIENEKNFTWIDGTVSSNNYENWASGFDINDGENSDCVFFSSSGEWNHRICGDTEFTRKAFVCNRES